MTTTTIETFTTSQLIAELVTRGVLKAEFADKEAKRSARAAAKSERAAAISTAMTGILEVLANPELKDNNYFSVKTTGNSVGFMTHVTGERSVILKALTQLVKDDKVRKIGLSGGVEKLTSEVNAFQIRYARATKIEVAAKEEEAVEESAEETK
tara:strand:+ start:2308 stop:2769 length:462 start_codon:yes stop_codon:yes gene_type:complete